MISDFKEWEKLREDNKIGDIIDDETKDNLKGMMSKSEFESKKKEDIDVEIEEEIEEEEDDEFDDNEFFMTEDEMMLTKISDFFDKDGLKKMMSLNDLLKYRKDLTSKLYDFSKFNELQRDIISRRISITYLIEKYFIYLEDKFSNMKILRYIGQINDEMRALKKKSRVIFYKELHDIHGFDNGVIYYWVFNDAVVFKTI